MKLAQDRFYKSDCHKIFYFQNEKYTTKYDRYTYESKSTLYDVDVRKTDGNKTFHVNMGFATERTEYHNEIIRHFNI